MFIIVWWCIFACITFVLAGIYLGSMKNDGMLWRPLIFYGLVFMFGILTASLFHLLYSIGLLKP